MRAAAFALLACAAAGAVVLLVASVHAALLGEKLVGGGLGDGMRRNSAIFAVVLAAASAVLLTLLRMTLRIARTRQVPSLPRQAGLAARALAAPSGAVAIVAGFWVSLPAMIATSAWQHPDPSVPDGDPCCGHPDTWGDVAVGTAYALAIGAVAAGLVTLGAGLVWVAATGRVPSFARRPSAFPAAAAVVALAAAVPGSWLLTALVAGDYP